jgi:hypothetical protein
LEIKTRKVFESTNTGGNYEIKFTSIPKFRKAEL